jgi:hypothetical protein
VIVAGTARTILGRKGHQRRIGAKSTENLFGLGIVEGVETTLERFAIEHHHARASGRFAAVQVCGVFTKDLLLRVQALQNITDRRVGGRSLPTDRERPVQTSPVRLDEGANASVRVGAGHNRQNGQQQNMR